jgi:EmrB/QacA subfamily drug resistance transporter
MNSRNLDRRWIAMALLAVAQFVVVLDASIVNVALPSIGRGLHLTQDSLSWVVNGYVLTFGGFLLLGGRAADLIGRRITFIVGLAIFAVASLAGGLADSEGTLIAARAVQGFGAALLSPAALSLVTTIFTEGAERNKALGIWGAVAGSGGAAGVLLGGVLTSGLGWRAVLFVNTPIGIAAALAAPALLPEARGDGATRSFDAAGAVTVTGGLTAIVYGLVEAPTAGWGSLQTIGLLALGTVLLAAFAVIETRSQAPLVPPRIFRVASVAGANATGLLIGASLFSMFFFISLYMQQVLGYGALKAGISYLPLAGVIVVAAGLASQLTNRLGFKPVLLTGMALVATALIWFAQVPTHGAYAANLLGPMLVAAAGLGLAFVPVTIAAMTGVREHEAGLASGLINTAQQVGGALGLAVLATIANSRTTSEMKAAHGAPSALHHALTLGFHSAFLTGAGLALLGLVLAALLIRTRGGEAVPATAAVATESATA